MSLSALGAGAWRVTILPILFVKSRSASVEAMQCRWPYGAAQALRMLGRPHTGRLDVPSHTQSTCGMIETARITRTSKLLDASSENAPQSPAAS